MARYRYRPPGQVSARAVLAGVAVAVVAASAASGPARAGHHARRPSVAAEMLPAAPAYTPQTWARQILADLGEPLTPCNRVFLLAWMAHEGGHWHNTALHNPLNTTRREPGSWVINSKGVRGYPTWASGFTATVATFRNGLYRPVLSELAYGKNAQAAANKVAASDWGTKPFEVSC